MEERSPVRGDSGEQWRRSICEGEAECVREREGWRGGTVRLTGVEGGRVTGRSQGRRRVNGGEIGSRSAARGEKCGRLGLREGWWELARGTC